jgi:hypothetical protein
MTITTYQGSATFKTTLKHRLKPNLSGYPETLIVWYYPMPLKPIVRPDSDIEH